MSDEIINVFVNMGMNGRGSSTFPVRRSMKVADFIQAVIDKEGALGVRIIAMGKPLTAKRNGKEMKLSDYGVYDGLNMSAALRLKGGAEGPNATRFDIKEVETIGATVLCDPNKPNGPQGDCIYGINEGCYESNVPKAKLQCGCIWCADCMKFYVNKQIEVNAMIKLSCGDSTHGGASIDIGLAYAIAALSPDERNKYNAKMNETQFKRPDSLMSHCPYGKCQKFVFRENTGSTKVECGVCHKFMCWKCKKEFKGKQDGHCGNEHCDDAAHIALLLAQAQVKDIYGVKVTDTRICPNKECCAVNVHDTACRHMTCKICKHEYCHICLQDYKGHEEKLCKVAPEQTITSDMKWTQ